MRKAFFEQDGQCLVITTPKTPTPWTNWLFNREYFVQASQRLCGASFSVREYKQTPVLQEEKQFFVRTGQGLIRLCAGAGNSYSCRHTLSSSSVTEVFDDFSCEITVFVPVSGKRECWQIRFFDLKPGCMIEDVYAAFPFANIDYQGLQCEYVCDHFEKQCYPYYITYQEQKAAEQRIQRTWAASFPACTSYECNYRRYTGGNLPGDVPLMAENGRGSCQKSEFEPCVAAFHHHVGSREEVKISYAIQALYADENYADCVLPDFEEELCKARQWWKQRVSSFFIHSGNDQMDAMTNFWLKKQVIYLTTHNRGGVYCPVRNQLQDALGYAMIDPQDAMRYAMNVLRRQTADGNIKQWYMTDGSPDAGLCRIHHSDGPIWLILCMLEIIRANQDMGLLQKTAPYLDHPKEKTILDHLRKAARYMRSQLGQHGLCLLKDGDWTDPINGAGRFGRGESVWNTEALVFSLKLLYDACRDAELLEFADELTSNLQQHAWDQDRFIVGYDDEGVPFGTREDREGSLFLNTQVWALIAGICTPRQKTILQKNIETLHTDHGYRLLQPAFSSYNAQWGKISVKQKGATENGSIYSHANLFKAYADCISGRLDDAWRTLSELLPDAENSLQPPIYLPNYFFGLDGDNFARSSCVYSSGAPAWWLWIMKTYFTK